MNTPRTKVLTKSKSVYFLMAYIVSCTIFPIWLLFDGWLTNFSSIFSLFGAPSEEANHETITFVLFTCVGSLLGSALLSIVSFHRYVAVEKSFDRDHIFGFMFSPFLAFIVGIMTFCILHSGIFILSGNQAADTSSISASLGHIAIGAVAGYNWDVFVKKVQNLSTQLFKENGSKG